MQYPPLTDDEQDRRRNVDTPVSERLRLYGRDLLATASAYAVAADAKDLNAGAARFLAGESERLHREGQAALERADDLESR